jgi:hypothetical protein
VASRADRKRREREARGDFGTPGVRAVVDGGVTQLAIDTRALPVPKQSYYANVFKIHHRENVVCLLFGQLAPGLDDQLHAVVSIEVPEVAITWLVSTFDDTFRNTVAKVSGAQPAYPATTGVLPQSSSLCYPAHITRLVLNDVGAVLDFYELVPSLTNPSDVVPLLRVKALAPLLRFFIQECDRFVASMETTK